MSHKKVPTQAHLDTLPAWAQTLHLIYLSRQSELKLAVISSSEGVSEDLPPRKPSRGAMAVANFQYITRINSGFKVYILEGELDLITPCCLIEYL